MNYSTKLNLLLFAALVICVGLATVHGLLTNDLKGEYIKLGLSFVIGAVLLVGVNRILD